MLLHVFFGILYYFPSVSLSLCMRLYLSSLPTNIFFIIKIVAIVLALTCNILQYFKFFACIYCNMSLMSLLLPKNPSHKNTISQIIYRKIIATSTIFFYSNVNMIVESLVLSLYNIFKLCCLSIHNCCQQMFLCCALISHFQCVCWN